MAEFVKFDILKAIYQFYEDYVTNFDFVCQPGCATCCTQHVFITTLEGAFIIKGLEEVGQSDILKRLISVDPNSVFSPKVSTNRLAAYCLRRQEPPEEDITFASSECPFLENGLCLIYSLRPFACRSFFSQKRCDLSGEAIIPPQLVTVNILINQFIEHVDTPGYYGNLVAILSFLQKEENLGRYYLGSLPQTDNLAQNQPIPGFLYPPEHELEVKKVINKLALLRIGKIEMKFVIKEILKGVGHV